MDVSKNISLSPAVAVVIPTYNRWPHVSAAIISCLAQSHSNVEVIIVDDGSTDGTADKIRSQHGDQVTLIQMPENVEKSRARNEGIRSTNAEFVCMLDSDDVLHPDSISNRLRIFLDDPSFDGVSYGSTLYIGRKNNVDHSLYPSGDVLHAYLDNFSLLNNNAFLLRRETMLEHGMYRDKLTNMEDRELLIRLTARLPFRYCGSVVQSVHRIEKSARSCYCRLMRQGCAMTSHLKEDAELIEKLGTRMRDIEFMENYELVRAQYKLRMYKRYEVVARELVRKYPDRLRGNARFHKRLFTAKLLKYFVRPIPPGCSP